MSLRRLLFLAFPSHRRRSAPCPNPRVLRLSTGFSGFAIGNEFRAAFSPVMLIFPYFLISHIARDRPVKFRHIPCNCAFLRRFPSESYGKLNQIHRICIFKSVSFIFMSAYNAHMSFKTGISRTFADFFDCFVKIWSSLHCVP